MRVREEVCSRATSILTDIHFWVPAAVPLGGLLLPNNRAIHGHTRKTRRGVLATSRYCAAVAAKASITAMLGTRLAGRLCLCWRYAGAL